MNLVLTVNLPFGAAVLLAFFWRRLTAAAVWWCVILTTLVVLVIPWTASHVPGLRDHPGLTRMTAAAGGAAPAPVFYNRVVRERPGDPASPFVAAPGLNRLNLECWLLSRTGVDVDVLSRTQRVTLQFLFDGIFPFVVLLAASLLTRPTDARRVAEFYGKMKTPVGATPELEAAALEATRSDPARFDHTKLWPRSNWEFCRWDRVDTIGFLVCSALSAAIVLLFVGFLRWAAP
jgi:SSS family solute:Na+ symporter